MSALQLSLSCNQYNFTTEAGRGHGLLHEHALGPWVRAEGQDIVSATRKSQFSITRVCSIDGDVLVVESDALIDRIDAVPGVSCEVLSVGDADAAESTLLNA